MVFNETSVPPLGSSDLPSRESGVSTDTGAHSENGGLAMLERAAHVAMLRVVEKGVDDRTGSMNQDGVTAIDATVGSMDQLARDVTTVLSREGFPAMKLLQDEECALEYERVVGSLLDASRNNHRMGVLRVAWIPPRGFNGSGVNDDALSGVRKPK